MEGADPTSAFRRLDVHDRRAKLVAFLDVLTAQECRDATEYLKTRTFQFDIVGHLPFELVLQVFSYLDIGAPFRFRVVSKQWNRVLQSPKLLDRPLREYYGTSGWVTSGNGDHDAARREKTEHIHRHRRGRYFSSLAIHFPAMGYVGHVLLRGDYFVWEGERCLKVCNLRSGHTWIARTPARERITDVAASEELVAFMAGRKCHVWTLTGSEVKTFSCPALKSVALVCRGRTVAFSTILINATQMRLIYIWDFDTGTGQDFTIRRPIDCNFALLLQPATNTVLVFSGPNFNAPDGEFADSAIHLARYTFEGEHLKEQDQAINFPHSNYREDGIYEDYITGAWKEALLEEGEFYIHEKHWFTFGNPRPVTSQGLFTLDMRYGEGSRSSGTVPFDLDEYTYQFVRSEDRFPHWNGSRYNIGRMNDGGPGAVSYGTLYDGTLLPRTRVALTNMDRDSEATNVLPKGLSSSFEYGWKEKWAEDEHVPRIYVNENFVLLYTPSQHTGHEKDRMEVYCFDKNIKLPTEALKGLLTGAER